MSFFNRKPGGWEVARDAAIAGAVTTVVSFAAMRAMLLVEDTVGAAVDYVRTRRVVVQHRQPAQLRGKKSSSRRRATLHSLPLRRSTTKRSTSKAAA